jgi:peptide/nickel transport system substrate-binding protein
MKRAAAFLIAAAFMASILLPHLAHAQPPIPTPREETVVLVEFLPGVWDKFNPFIPMGIADPTYQTIAQEYCIYINYATGERIFWLIEGYEYKDGFKTFIMHVRKGVTWNDGRPLTSKDFKFTIEMVKRTPGLYWHAWAAEWVESVETPDDYTVVIKLTKPNPRFHYAFQGAWSFPVVPEHVWKGQDPLTFKNFPPVATGPYKLYKVIPEHKMVVWVRRDDYWAARLWGPDYLPKPKYIIRRYWTTADLEYKAWIEASWDCTHATNFFTRELLERGLREGAPYTSYYLMFDPCPRGIWINCKKYPLSLPEVRWAIALCLDRQLLTKYWIFDTIPAKYPWADWGALRKWAFPEIFEKNPLEFNLEKAAKILDDLGFKPGPDGIRVTPNGTRLSFVILVREPFIQHLFYAEHLASNLRKIGVEAIVKTMPTGPLVEAIETGQFDMVAMWLCTGMPWQLDPYGLLEGFHSKYMKPIGERQLAGQWCRFSDPELDKIIDQLESLSPDDPRAVELAKKGIEILWKNMPVIPVIETTYAMAWNTKYWVGWPTAENYYIVTGVWWPQFLFIIFKLRPSHYIGAYTTVWFTDKVPKNFNFTGWDNVKYGPFKPGDSATIPVDDARLLIELGWATATPPVPRELVATFEKISADVSALSSKIDTVSTAVARLSEELGALRGTLTTLIAVNVICLVLLLGIIALLIRGKGTATK